MKAIILITTVFLSQFCLAGTGGGGVMAVTEKGNGSGTMRGGGSVGTLKSGSEIVFNIGKRDGLVKFAYGQLVDNQWQIQNVEMAEAELIGDLSVIEALKNSKSVNDWADLK